jgi:uncharacterized protein GlcG (DUF336 family)
MRKYSASLVMAALIVLYTAGAGYAQEVLTEQQISLSVAYGLGAGAVEPCWADGFRVSAAVVDRSRAKALLRMTMPHTLDSSRKKVFTASSFRTSTSELQAWLRTIQLRSGDISMKSLSSQADLLVSEVKSSAVSGREGAVCGLDEARRAGLTSRRTGAESELPPRSVSVSLGVGAAISAAGRRSLGIRPTLPVHPV